MLLGMKKTLWAYEFIGITQMCVCVCTFSSFFVLAFAKFGIPFGSITPFLRRGVKEFLVLLKILPQAGTIIIPLIMKK